MSFPWSNTFNSVYGLIPKLFSSFSMLGDGILIIWFTARYIMLKSVSISAFQESPCTNGSSVLCGTISAHLCADEYISLVVSLLSSCQMVAIRLQMQDNLRPLGC